MGILLGLTAAVCWGVSDFLARYASRRVGALRSLFYIQPIGFVGLTTYLLLVGQLQEKAVPGNIPAWLWAVVGATLNIVASLALYRAFEIGVLAVVSPISASYAILSVVLSVLSGETLSLQRIGGVVIALFGVILAAITLAPVPEAGQSKVALRTSFLPRGVAWAMLAACAFGFNFWLYGFQVVPTLGGVIPVWLGRSIAIGLLPLVAVPTRQNLAVPRGNVWLLLIAMGIIDTAANVAASVGVGTDQVSVVSVLSSLFSAVTVMLAWVFLREKLAWFQWLGIVLIFAGIVLVSVK